MGEEVGGDGAGELVVGQVDGFEDSEFAEGGNGAGEGVVDEADGAERGDLGEGFDVYDAGEGEVGEMEAVDDVVGANDAHPTGGARVLVGDPGGEGLGVGEGFF